MIDVRGNDRPAPRDLVPNKRGGQSLPDRHIFHLRRDLAAPGVCQLRDRGIGLEDRSFEPRRNSSGTYALGGQNGDHSPSGNPAGSNRGQPEPHVKPGGTTGVVYPERRLTTGEPDFPEGDAHALIPFDVHLARVGKVVAVVARRRGRLLLQPERTIHRCRCRFQG